MTTAPVYLIHIAPPDFVSDNPAIDHTTFNSKHSPVEQLQNAYTFVDASTQQSETQPAQNKTLL